MAELRARGLAASTIARRLAALRSFFRHQMLIGAQDGNPPRRSPAAPRAPAAAHAFAPAKRSGSIEAANGTRPARSPRPGPRRAPVRRGAAGQRGGRARAKRGRPRRTARSLDRQGRQGAGRAARPQRRRRPAPLPEPAAGPFLDQPPPARALPERQGRRADARGRVPDPQAPGRESRASNRRGSIRICSATRSRRTCSREAPIYGASRRCSATPISPRRSSTRT